ncbi:MAG: hypothetical protein DMG14_15570 [Acidobacteria bacterium]|nr:MAG: hypothetical protein DMG14_15570 [Acidobacteriota bacterium]
MQILVNAKRFVIAATTVLALSLLSTPLFAQPWWTKVPTSAIPHTPDGKVDLSAPAPRLPDGKPDFSGVWNPPTGYLRDLSKDLKEPVLFQAWAKAVYDERAAGLHWRDEPDANCLPQGVPKVLLAPAPWRMVQTPERIFFVHEAFNLWWQVFMDGREFVPSKDVTPTWHGYSTGKWDGDTLVIDSRGFNGKVWLDQLGKPSTEALHVNTRLRRKDFGHLDIQITIDDPEAYMKPWTVNVEVGLVPNAELMEFICLENERDVRGPR